MTNKKAAQKYIFRVSPNIRIERTVVMSMAHEMRKRRVMLFPCLNMADMMRPHVA